MTVITVIVVLMQVITVICESRRGEVASPDKIVIPACSKRESIRCSEFPGHARG